MEEVAIMDQIINTAGPSQTDDHGNPLVSTDPIEKDSPNKGIHLAVLSSMLS